MKGLWHFTLTIIGTKTEDNGPAISGNTTLAEASNPIVSSHVVRTHKNHEDMCATASLGRPLKWGPCCSTHKTCDRFFLVKTLSYWQVKARQVRWWVFDNPAKWVVKTSQKVVKYVSHNALLNSERGSNGGQRSWIKVITVFHIHSIST